MIKKQKFDEVYSVHQDTLYRYVLTRVQDPERTSDICQEVFSKYFENMMEIQDDMISPWLILCAKNKCVDFWRTHRRAIEMSYEACAQTLELISENGLERVIECSAQREFIIKLLAELREKNEKWYEVVEAVCIYEMPQTEAARYLGISAQVLRARLGRARKFLRKRFEKEYREL